MTREKKSRPASDGTAYDYLSCMAYNDSDHSSKSLSNQSIFSNIPNELRVLKQWICWGFERVANRTKLAKVPYTPGTFSKASATNPDTWRTYDEAIASVATRNFDGIGFVLTEHDSYVFVDFDVAPEADGLSAHQIALGEALGSYSELSPSGKGAHVIVKGKLPPGSRNRNGTVEIYDCARYMTMTGNSFGNPHIIDNQPVIDRIVSELGKGQTLSGHIDLNAPQTEDDRALWDRALQAKNGGRFGLLWNGQWQALHPSQSEADYDLCEMLAFSCRNDPCFEQIVRLFRLSGLGQRSKASRDDYVMGTALRAVRKVAEKREQQRRYMNSPEYQATVAALIAAANSAALKT
ncbi:MAG: hypothetical protein KJ871_04275 [Alphaproteobacteria bacterium]|nr:hypothetical protein [Alphaproteobacteria bacterium]MBU2082602.1 hypothetical protein [Alphaproteobacteria bacterium]MBU2142758.1 hypothetical protein [Alphaproteobacteria bacterium]MBU2195180.1 hypothetical protein [Alphaproteobacteria bacterium]